MTFVVNIRKYYYNFWLKRLCKEFRREKKNKRRFHRINLTIFILCKFEQISFCNVASHEF